MSFVMFAVDSPFNSCFILGILCILCSWSMLKYLFAFVTSRSNLFCIVSSLAYYVFVIILQIGAAYVIVGLSIVLYRSFTGVTVSILANRFQFIG